MITLDGSDGEGGGQILRTALALSMVTGQGFELSRIRAKRKRPGLMRQHLTALRAAAAVSGAEVEGDALGSEHLRFRPRAVVPQREGRFEVGTAGSATLVLQTIAPALLRAADESSVICCGGTHNPFAPPFDFLELAFAPAVAASGLGRLELALDRAGFYPAGGGMLRATIRAGHPGSGPPMDWTARTAPRRRWARIYHKGLPGHIKARERDVLQGPGGFAGREIEEVEPESAGPGNAVLIGLEFETHTEVCTGFGEPRVPAERVAEVAVQEARRIERAAVRVGPHLADQLLLPLTLGAGGRYLTVEPTEHWRTAARLIARFVRVEIGAEQVDAQCWLVTVGAANG